MDQNTPSGAGDFTMEESIITLPRRNAAGALLRVRIRAATPGELSATFEGVPVREKPAAPAGVDDGAGADPDAAKRLREEANKRILRLVRASCIEPRFAVEPGQDGVPIESLHYDNREALVGAVYALSGLVLPEVAERTLGFRVVERGGIALGSSGGESVPAAAPAT